MTKYTRTKLHTVQRSCCKCSGSVHSPCILDLQLSINNSSILDLHETNTKVHFRLRYKKNTFRLCYQNRRYILIHSQRNFENVSKMCPEFHITVMLRFHWSSKICGILKFLVNGLSGLSKFRLLCAKFPSISWNWSSGDSKRTKLQSTG